MGHWVMIVEGHGIHDNTDTPGDADRLFAEFVQKLRYSGHAVHAASFTSGGTKELDLMPAPADASSPAEYPAEYNLRP